MTSHPLDEVARRASAWLLEVAAPGWSVVGRTNPGLFAGRITLAGEPDADYFRTFVQARHIFAFVTIGRLGWKGPWRELVGETTKAVLRGAKRADGFYVHRHEAHGAALGPRADPSEQGCLLFPPRIGWGALGGGDAVQQTEALLLNLKTR